MPQYPFTFPKISGKLIKRLNRFAVEVEVEGRQERAYLPNTGRLWELLLPGTTLLLSPALSRGKLPYTVLACRKGAHFVLLHTHLTNEIAHRLIDEGRIPPYRDYRVVKREPAYGRHRFDLLLEHRRNGRPFYLEIKNNTLFESRTAMFPGAITERGATHLRLLKELASENVGGGCLFMIMSPQVEYFLPAYHIDYRFSQTFLDVKNFIRTDAFALGFDPDFTEVITIEPVKIPHRFIEDELRDRGFYLLLLELAEPKTITPQDNRRVLCKEGYYVCVGKAEKELNREAARHKQKSKKKKRPIDHLTAEAEMITPIPIITGEPLASGLVDRLGPLADRRIAGPFSGNGIIGPLFYFSANPLLNRGFINLIQDSRIIQPEQRLRTGGYLP